MKLALIAFFTITVLVTTSLFFLIINQNKYIFITGGNISEFFKKYKMQIPTEDGSKMDLIYVEKASDIDLIFFYGNCVFENEICQLSLKLAETTGANVFSPLYSGVNNDYKSTTEKNLTGDLNSLAKILNRRTTKKIIFGFSFGTAMSIRMASKIQDLHCVFLMNPFASLDRVVAEIIPIPLIEYLIFDKWNNIDLIDGLNIPCYYFISENDRLINPTHSEDLIIKTKDPIRIVVPNADHNDIWRCLNFQTYVEPYLIDEIQHARGSN